MVETQTNFIEPQRGYQSIALSSPADILIGGGAAGVGKTFSLLLEPLRNISIPNFGAVAFRRTSPQIRAEGGLWDASTKLYSMVSGSSAKQSVLEWSFPNDVKIKFSHLEYEKNVFDWQGSEIPLIMFDELTHFTKSMFFYMLSRNRSTCGVKPYVRATCNPDPDSWVYELIEWWIDDDGFPILERQGQIRYFFRDGDSMIWGDSVEEVKEKASYILDDIIEKSGLPAKNFIKSLTFVGGSIYDNKKLLDVDPSYLGNLLAQDEDTKRQLFEGNWKVSVNPMDIYDYTAFKDIFTNDFVLDGDKYITVDVAMGGKNKLIAKVWSGFRIIDILIIPKSNGGQVISSLKSLQSKHNVPNRNLAYDADGVGSFIGGEEDALIPNSIPFNNNAKQIETDDHRLFKNLKTQCYVLSGERVSRNEIYMTEEVANKMYDDNKTVRQRLLEERKAIKRKPKRDEEPLALIPKDEMKQKYLNGTSSDLMDSFMMREIFELKNNNAIYTINFVDEIPNEAQCKTYAILNLGLYAQAQSHIMCYKINNDGVFVYEMKSFDSITATEIKQYLFERGVEQLNVIANKADLAFYNMLRGKLDIKCTGDDKAKGYDKRTLALAPFVSKINFLSNRDKDYMTFVTRLKNTVATDDFKESHAETINCIVVHVNGSYKHIFK